MLVRSRPNMEQIPIAQARLLAIFLGICEWTPIYFGWRPNLTDEGDNHLIELAIAGQSRYLVTRNLRDLARMERRFPELRVCSPEPSVAWHCCAKRLERTRASARRNKR